MSVKSRLDQLNRSLKNGSVNAGFLEGAKYPDGERVAEVAFSNEFGKPENNQPPRPFMRLTVKKHSKDWIKTVGTAIQRGATTEQALTVAGGVMVAHIQQSIIDFDDPPNAAYTIEKKGFNNPLIDTRVMLKSVSFEVEE